MEITDITIYGSVAIVLILITAFILKAVKGGRNEVSGKVKEIRQILKFIPSELTFSVIHNYDDTAKGSSLFGMSKGVHAIVKMRTKVSVAFDLTQVKVKVNKVNQTIKISNIPTPEYLIELIDFSNKEDYEFITISKGGTWLTGTKMDSKTRTEIDNEARATFKKKVEESKAIGKIAKQTLLEMLQALNDNYVESGWKIDWDDSLKIN